MIIVHANFRCKPGERGRVVEIASRCIEATRCEPGCISYDLMASTEDDCSLMFVEKWSAMEALESHRGTKHLARFRDERAPYVEGPTEVEVYEASVR